MAAFMLGVHAGDCNRGCIEDGEDYGRWSIKDKCCYCYHKKLPGEFTMKVDLHWYEDPKKDAPIEEHPFKFDY